MFQPFNDRPLLLDSENIDPDINFYNEYLFGTSRYMTVCELSENHLSSTQNLDESQKFSMLYLNCRSFFRILFFPLINKPTRITPTSATIIDNIFTNANVTNTHDSVLLYDDISGHLPIFVSLKSNPMGTADKEKFISKRFYDEESKRNFLAYLQDYNWEEAIEFTACTWII